MSLSQVVTLSTIKEAEERLYSYKLGAAKLKLIKEIIYPYTIMTM